MSKFYFLPILLALFFYTLGFCQQNNESYNDALIIGELSGRVDSDDLVQLIKRNYYPISHNSEKTVYRITNNSASGITLEYINPQPFQPQKIIFRFFSSEMALLAALITEEIDFSITESATVAEEVHKSNPSVRILFQRKTDNFVKMIAYNNQHPFFKRTNIRRALSYAVDKQDILTNILNKQANIASGPLAKGSKLYVSGFKQYKYAPRKAIKLLHEEGWYDFNKDGILEKNGKTLNFTLCYEKGILPDEYIARMIKVDWNKIGIDVSIKPLPKKEIKARLKIHKFDALITNLQFNETRENFEYVFGSKSSGNFFGFHNKTVDHYLDLAKRANLQTHNRLLQGVVNIVVQEQPATFLFFLWLDWYFVNGNKFENFLDSRGKLRPFNEWRFKQK